MTYTATMNKTAQDIDTTTETARRVLIVDDDQFLLDMYMVKFKGAGYVVEGFTESQAALDELQSGVTFDAILLDLIMPGMDGIELMKQIREQNLVSDTTAVIVLSNQGQDTDMDQAKQYGIDGYLIKASTVPSEVLTFVEKAINKKQHI